MLLLVPKCQIMFKAVKVRNVVVEAEAGVVGDDEAAVAPEEVAARRWTPTEIFRYVRA